MDAQSKQAYRSVLIFILVLTLMGFVLATPREILQGFTKIMLASDILITDYISVAGTGPALVNVAIVTLTTVVLMYRNKVPMHGGGIVTIGLMSGFSFFGKNFFNMWFILIGTYLFSIVKKEPYSKYIIVSLLSTALGPLISTTFFSNGITLKGVLVSITSGLLIGFVMPMLAAHTERLLHGLNLYNGGFAIGLLAMVITPLLKSYGFQFNIVNHWSTGRNLEFGIVLYTVAVLFICGGYFSDCENSVKNYLNILKRPGVPCDDFTVLDGMPAVLINMGVNVIIATTCILVIGGDLNGPTLGGIFTIAGFSAKGKHARNIIPIMLGVLIGGFSRNTQVTPSAQLAVLFGTTLAPIAGTYGFLSGVGAGFVHSAVVMHAGAGYSGVNLYNNGFAGGIVSIVFYAVLSIFKKPNTYCECSPNMRKCDDIQNNDDNILIDSGDIPSESAHMNDAGQQHIDNGCN